MRALIVSRFPPAVCGIGQYAEAQATALESEGHIVERVNIDVESTADSWLPRPGRRLLHLLAKARRADRVFIHYHVDLFQDPRWDHPLARHALPHLLTALLAASRRERTTVIVHETSYLRYPGRSWRVQHDSVALLMRAAGEIVFHSEHERRAFTRDFFAPPRSRILPPNAFYVRRVDVDRREARRALAVPDEELVFLCIGFFVERKGFLDFALAFQEAVDGGVLPRSARLYVVTSLQPSASPQVAAAFAKLEQAAPSLSNITLITRFVSDSEFDSWLVAADWAVAPYLEGFTSSITARASRYGTPSILSGVGGLAEQAGPLDLVYNDRQALRAVLAAAGGDAGR